MLLTNITYAQVINMDVSPSEVNTSVSLGETSIQTITIHNSGNATLEWAIDGFALSDTVTFTKGNFADWTQTANQDRITDNVWLTRADDQGLFNIAQENRFSGNSSPTDTEWAFGNTVDLSPSNYRNWRSAVSSNPRSMIGNVISMHAISEDRYFDILFTSFIGNGSGGGFSYSRVETAPWLTSSLRAGSVEPGGSQDVVLTIDASDLVDGSYTAYLLFSSNAADRGTLRVPIELDITGGTPSLMTDASLSFSDTFLGGSTTKTLSIANDGTSALTITSISSDNSAFTLDNSQLTVPSASSTDITIIFAPDAVQDYTSNLTIIIVRVITYCKKRLGSLRTRGSRSTLSTFWQKKAAHCSVESFGEQCLLTALYHLSNPAG